MFSAKHSVKSTLLCGPAELSKSFMFEAAIYWAEEGRRVVYITPAPLESLPAACHDRSNPAPAAFKLMRFIWVVSRDKKAAIWITEFNGLKYNQDPIIEVDGFVGGPVDGTHCIISVYIPPNIEFRDFEMIVFRVESSRRNLGPGALVAGDLNAKSTLRGLKKNNRRSNVSAFFLNMGLIPINTAGSYRFERNAGVSKIDIPAFDRVAFRLVHDGRVLQDYSAPDQKYLLHMLYKRIINKSFHRQKKKREPVIWNIEAFDVTKFADEYERTVERIPEDEEMSVKDINKFLKYVNAVCTKTVKSTALTRRPPNIWWTEDMSNLRKETIKKRRILLRARKKGKMSVEKMAELEVEFKRSRRCYRLSRMDSKIRVWKQICEELEYMRYMNLVDKYEEGEPTSSLSKEEALAVIAHLFPISTEEQEEEQRMGRISTNEKESVQLAEDTNRNDEDIKISTVALRISR
ncbi:uncharacterized protein LOC143369232 isoform X1 [Andrena cerasifolii]|uniref:uncharacterized protein LOC143369232 isoform X1 n=1 Tax=Andrena cerasifolii TaxID=2819439 RepID=UPI0040380FC8